MDFVLENDSFTVVVTDRFVPQKSTPYLSMRMIITTRRWAARPSAHDIGQTAVIAIAA